jgi:hypothetical protein
VCPRSIGTRTTARPWRVCGGRFEVCCAPACAVLDARSTPVVGKRARLALNCSSGPRRAATAAGVQYGADRTL